MTSKEILQECKRKYINYAFTFKDGARSLEKFLYYYFKEMGKKYKTYNAFYKVIKEYSITAILTPGGLWYYEHDLGYYKITKAMDKKIKSVMTELNYKYLYDI